MKVLIVGASRGIGREFVDQYLADGAVVWATARSDPAIARLREQGARTLTLDVSAAESVARLAWQLDGERFDTVVYCPGIYGPRTSGLESPSQADFDAVMRSNVFGAMQVIPQLTDMLSAEGRLAVISSRMGAIGPRSSNSGWLYRASKAALNSVLKDVAIELSGRAICVCLHPGWVRTDMGGDAADLNVADSVTDMRRLLASLTTNDNGRFINHDGAAIDW